jgi:hypothetical protein
VKLLLAYDATRPDALLTALRDSDERVVYTGLLAAQSDCSPETAAVIRARIDADELAEGAVRAAGVRAVATVRDDATLEWVLRHTLVTSGILRKTRLAPASPELLASLNALATYWSDDARAALALSLARESTSPSVRGAARREGSVTEQDGA